MSPFLSRGSDTRSSNIGLRVSHTDAQSNSAATEQPADAMVRVNRTDLGQLKQYQKALERYVRAAIEARAATDSVVGLANVAAQVDNEKYFLKNLLPWIKEVQGALRNHKPLIHFLVGQAAVAPLQVYPEQVDKDLRQLDYLVGQRQDDTISLEDREVVRDKTRRTASDVNELFLWIADACKEKSTELLHAIDTLVDDLLEGPRRDSVGIEQDNSAAGRGEPITSADRHGGGAVNFAAGSAMATFGTRQGERR